MSATTGAAAAERLGSRPVEQVPLTPTPVRVGTRRSLLARTQSGTVAQLVREQLRTLGLAAEVELVEVTTQGDLDRSSLAGMGGTGVFVSALRTALLAGRIDCAVHSLKDLPTAPEPGIVLAAVPVREDPHDALVARDGLTLAQLPSGARVGTGSPRRAAQLRAARADLVVVDIRGNVDTRLALVHRGELDAVVLARAGLLRLGRSEEITEVLTDEVMLPAPGQGALAVECRTDDEGLRRVLSGLDDPRTHACVVAERALLARLEAGCAAPVGALATIAADPGRPGREPMATLDPLTLVATVVAPDGSGALRAQHSTGVEASDLGAAAQLGVALADHLLSQGAERLIPPSALATAHTHDADASAPERVNP